MATSMPHMEQKSKQAQPAPEVPVARPRIGRNLAGKISVLFLLTALLGILAGALRLAQLDAKFTLIPVVVSAFAVVWVSVSLYAWKRDRKDRVFAELKK